MEIPFSNNFNRSYPKALTEKTLQLISAKQEQEVGYEYRKSNQTELYRISYVRVGNCLGLGFCLGSRLHGTYKNFRRVRSYISVHLQPVCALQFHIFMCIYNMICLWFLFNKQQDPTDNNHYHISNQMNEIVDAGIRPLYPHRNFTTNLQIIEVCIIMTITSVCGLIRLSS